MALPQGAQELRVLPCKLSWLASLDRQIGAEQIDKTSLVEEVDTAQITHWRERRRD